jgi:peptide/nickel transport system substrate-binding protein
VVRNSIRDVPSPGRAAVVLVGILMLLAGSGAVAMTVPASAATTATFAEPAGETPNCIFPMISAEENCYSPVPLFDFQFLMYRPLYWFGDDGKAVFNPKLSLAKAPVWSGSGTTVTIRLKSYRWSDGMPVTSRDVEFWMNLLLANKSQWAAYVPGEFPDNVVKEAYPNSSTIVLTLRHPYSHLWFFYNELDQIIPIPQHAWDKTSATGAVGNFDQTPAGARAVYTFLIGQSNTPTTYITNQLWQVVDGPWKLVTFDPTTYYVSFRPNAAYSGPIKPQLTEFTELPFTSDAAEYDALRAGELTYGYLPLADINQIQSLEASGDKVVAWPDYASNYIDVNYTNPKTGPILSQLYIRQAMEHLIDQPELVRDVLKGYGYPTYGPVPLQPSSPFLSPQESHNPYPYSVSAARELLTEHGWTVKSSGTSTCAHAGTSAGDCGKGIKKGTKLAFKLLYASGNTAFALEIQAIQSSFTQAGIQVTPEGEPISQVYSVNVPCDRHTGNGCSWDLLTWGIGYVYTPYDPLPSDSGQWQSGASLNGSGYSSAVNDANIVKTTTDSAPTAMFTYENYLSHQLSGLWIPNEDWQVSVISGSLHGATPQDPYTQIYPEQWRLGS